MIRFSNVIFLSGTFAFLVLMNAWPVQYPEYESGRICYIDAGQLSFKVNEDEIVSDSNAAADLFEEDGLFYLNMCVSENCEYRLTFVLENVSVNEGIYELNQPSDRHVSLVTQGNQCTHSTDDYYTGSLNIQIYDRVERRISGCFYFIAYAPDCYTLIKVSDGRFNLHLKEEQSI